MNTKKSDLSIRAVEHLGTMQTCSVGIEELELFKEAQRLASFGARVVEIMRKHLGDHDAVYLITNAARDLCIALEPRP